MDNLSKTSVSLRHENLHKQALITLLVTLGMSAIYLLLNHRVVSNAQDNFLFMLEQQLPFYQHMVWWYFLALLVAITIPILITCSNKFRQLMVANAISFSLNALVWFLYPVTYPRYDYSDQLSGYSERLYSQLISMDTSLNSFPSGHATLLMMMFWLSLSLDSKRWKLTVILLSLLGLLSIVLIKQHSIVDAVGGFATALFGIVISRVILEGKNKRLN